jgi:hypothetical protein
VTAERILEAIGERDDELATLSRDAGPEEENRLASQLDALDSAGEDSEDRAALRDTSRVSPDTAKRNSTSWGRYISFGFLAGAALGTTAAFLATHAPGVTDHSEDALAYIVFIPTGALFGTLVGGVLAITNRWQPHSSPAR